jgi:hypothetical protein
MIRETDEYKSMTPYMAVGLAEGFEEAETEEQVLAAWQFLHDTELAYNLQGWFGRRVIAMIEAEVIEA